MTFLFRLLLYCNIFQHKSLEECESKVYPLYLSEIAKAILGVSLPMAGDNNSNILTIFIGDPLYYCEANIIAIAYIMYASVSSWVFDLKRIHFSYCFLEHIFSHLPCQVHSL